MNMNGKQKNMALVVIDVQNSSDIRSTCKQQYPRKRF